MRSKGQFQKKEPKRTAAPLVLLVISSLSVAVLVISDLDWTDRVSDGRGVLLFISGLVFFTSLFNMLNLASLASPFIKKYKISTTDAMDISNKIVSAVQALFCCLTGLTICCYSCTRDMLKTSHYISEAYAWFGAAYFLYDIWSMYEVHISAPKVCVETQQNGELKEAKQGQVWRFADYLVKNPVIVMHHLFIGGFGFLFITYLRGGLGDCFFGFIYLMEASTPFVSLRGVLSKMGLKNSKWYIANGLVMLVVFFLCRVAMFPYVIYLYAKSVGLDFFTAVKSLPTGCKVSISVLLYPQIYWFYLMVRGAVKVLKPKVVRVTGAKRKQLKNSHS